MRPPDVYDDEMQGTRLRELARAAGYTEMAKFARAAGIEPGTADKHVQRESVPARAAKKYIEAARGTGADANWLLYGRGQPPKQMSAVVPIQKNVTPAKVTAYAVDDGSYVVVPLWAIAARRGPGGQVLIAETSDTVLAPPEMRNSKSAFGLQVWDDANAPWVRRGSLLFVDPVRIPADGQYCLLAAEAVGEDTTTFYRPVLGILEKVEPGHWVLTRGAKTERYAVAEWPLAFLVQHIRHA